LLGLHLAHKGEGAHLGALMSDQHHGRRDCRDHKERKPCQVH
jgi:hypothetical protein